MKKKLNNEVVHEQILTVIKTLFDEEVVSLSLDIMEHLRIRYDKLSKQQYINIFTLVVALSKCIRNVENETDYYNNDDIKKIANLINEIN